jgi:hypothetical protein
MMTRFFAYGGIFILGLLCNFSFAQKISLSGQAVGWGTINPASPFNAQTGLRYIPELNYEENYESNISFDAHLSLNGYANQIFWSNDSSEFSNEIKPYRFWVKYSGERIELRGGLQKINFGSAQLLRPLMWFDKIDPRDPLQMTDGVYGALARYYFLNNANIWLWTLIANDEQKGWEFFPSIKSKPEFGGRIQIPLFTGEIATTYHFRKANTEGTFADTLSSTNRFDENRFGLDFKLDYELGFWMEMAIIHQNIDFTKETNRQLLTIGTDYTFNIGNGLTLISEYFSFGNHEEVFGFKNNASFGAMSLNYPINIINSLSGMLYYDFENQEFYRFINWSMQYDKWSFYLMAFWNPDKFQIYQNASDAGLFSGKGFQLMAVFNH